MGDKITTADMEHEGMSLKSVSANGKKTYTWSFDEDGEKTKLVIDETKRTDNINGYVYAVKMTSGANNEQKMSANLKTHGIESNGNHSMYLEATIYGENSTKMESNFHIRYDQTAKNTADSAGDFYRIDFRMRDDENSGIDLNAGCEFGAVSTPGGFGW